MKKIFFIGVFLFLMAGCSHFLRESEQIDTAATKVPELNTINQYQNWATENNITLIVLDEDGCIVNENNVSDIIDTLEDEVYQGEYLTIIVERNFKDEDEICEVEYVEIKE